ncbi:N-acetyltransferase [Betaproteobacteria bacterium GR16-43]|nr:N-acetyltransferase [Betaproteobacteria bacterium GR16-43]
MTATPFLEPVALQSPHALLVPLSLAHHDDLVAATRDGELWKLWYTTVPSPEAMRADIERRIGLREHGTLLPFAVVDPASGKAVGVTNYMNVDPVHRRLEIGGTWYRASSQRTSLNTGCKLLLLEHAFEKKDCIAVEFRTHFMNHQSRRGIERLGAKLDGVLRSHMRMANGTLRDSCVYSITAAEWPTVKAHLAWQLARPRS